MKVEIAEASPNKLLTFAQVPVGSFYMRDDHTFLKISAKDAICFNCGLVRWNALEHSLAGSRDRHLLPEGTKITLTV